MKNVRIRVVESCGGSLLWWYRLYIGNRPTSLYSDSFEYKGNVIRAAKAMAKRLGILYDPEIIKQHGC